MLIDMMYDKNISLYQLQKQTNIAYTTLHDLYSLKTHPDKISVQTLSQISKVFDLSMDNTYKRLKEYTTNIYSEKYKTIGSCTLTCDKEIITKFSFRDKQYVLNDIYKTHKYLKQVFASSNDLFSYKDAWMLQINAALKNILDKEHLNILKKEYDFYGTKSI